VAGLALRASGARLPVQGHLAQLHARPGVRRSGPTVARPDLHRRWPIGEAAPDFERILRPRAYCGRCDIVVESQQAWKNGKTVGRYRQSYVYVHGACGTVVEPGFLPAAAAIDWTIPGERIGDRLKPKTRARIAAGIARYWGPIHIEATGNQYDAADPNHPQHGNPNAYYRAWSVEEYLRVLHTAETKALACPPLVTRHYGIEGGHAARHSKPVDEALRTVTASGGNMSLLTPMHVSLMGTCDHHVHNSARPVDRELRTLTAEGNNDYLLSAYYGNSTEAKPVTEPIGTLTTVDRYALIHRNNSGGAEMTTRASDYMRTLTAAGHQALIQSAPRGGRPKVTPADMKAAEDMVPECLFRMFRPHEVAAGMAFPADYDWHPDKTKPVSNRDLVKMAGNAVTPPAARDLMAAAVDSLGGAA
jgi:DNA (cytosine-5)-methyltransferase 1